MSIFGGSTPSQEEFKVCSTLVGPTNNSDDILRGLFSPTQDQHLIRAARPDKTNRFLSNEFLNEDSLGLLNLQPMKPQSAFHQIEVIQADQPMMGPSMN